MERTMKELLTTQELVKSILINDAASRNDDNYLILKVISYYGAKKGIDVNTMPVTRFMLNMKDIGIPSFETVRRARQKLQSEYPQLRGSREVQRFRDKNRGIYKTYSQGEV